MKNHLVPPGAILALLLCASSVLNAADTPAKNDFNVRDYGAVGDGKNLDSPAIDKAIAAAAEAGGRHGVCPGRNLSERLDSSPEQHPSAH